MTPEQEKTLKRVVYELSRKGIYTKPPHTGKKGDVFLRTGARHVCLITPDGTCTLGKTATQWQKFVLLQAQAKSGEDDPLVVVEPTELQYLFHVKQLPVEHLPMTQCIADCPVDTTTAFWLVVCMLYSGTFVAIYILVVDDDKKKK